MSERDPEATLEEWKASMQAEQEAAIRDPDPDADHRIEGVAQVTFRVRFAYDPGTDELAREDAERVDDFDDPELVSCVCGVRGMTRAEARAHMASATREP